MHDARMLAVSDLYDVYMVPTHLGSTSKPLFRIGVLTRQMENFNEKMSAARVSVE